MASPAWVSRQEHRRNRCYFRTMSRAESWPPETGMNTAQLSVVVPFLDEEDVLPEFVKTLRNALDKTGRTYEVIFVDDGSSDGGTAWVNQLCNHDWNQAQLVRLTRNFGHMQALTAGLDAASGEWIASLDADLQHPPELIGQLLTLAEETDSPVAQAVRVSRRGDKVGKRLAAQSYYAAAKRFGTSISLRSCTSPMLIRSRSRREKLSTPFASPVKAASSSSRPARSLPQRSPA